MTHRPSRAIRHRREIIAVLIALAALGAVAIPSVGADTPIASQSIAVPDEGAKLFIAYNCADCHGAGGSGSMAPSLADGRYRFGGSKEEIARSIAEGRPEGMPAWGTMIDRRQIEVLAAYVQSLSVGKDVSTENFTGATVERTGH